jgi:hypothetical protein
MGMQIAYTESGTGCQTPGAKEKAPEGAFFLPAGLNDQTRLRYSPVRVSISTLSP